MKIEKLKLKNFRGFRDEVEVKFDNLTALVGKNDIGKSTLLEALDIFFNDNRAIHKLEQADLNVDVNDCKEKHHEISITVCFTDVPEKIIIGTTDKGTIITKYLLNKDKELEIIKKYKISANNNNLTKTFMQPRIFIRTFRPTILKHEYEMVNNIPSKYIKIPYITSPSSSRLRRYNNTIEITSELIWEKLQTYMPLYSLFQADRKNTDDDNEVQDPFKDAIKEILSDNTIQQKLNEVATTVETKLNDVANRTLAKIREMDPAIAKTLQPVTQPFDSLNWQDIFKNVSIVSDENIPINKRGSGVKRLILLNFFRAEVERRQHETNLPNVIYAIEEPEISQHSENQKKLIEALTQLTQTAGVQVIITTHSPIIVKALNFNNIRIVSKDNKGSRKVVNTPPQVLPYPSLNEVNYIAFSEISEGYHDELYGHLYEKDWLDEYNNTKKKNNYIQEYRNKFTREIETTPRSLSQTQIIRHQIHHPENRRNRRFTEDELRTSIEEMRKFIQDQNSQTDQQE